MPGKKTFRQLRDREAAEAALQIILEVLEGAGRRKLEDADPRASRRKRTQIQRWHSPGDIVGFGIGRKEVGAVATDRIALRIYVRHKRPLSLLRVANTIPPSLDWPELPSAPVLDVVEMEPFEPASNGEGQQTAAPGMSAGHCITGETGTIGALVRAFDDNERYLLGAAHVFAAAGRGRLNDAIIQPGALDGGRCPDHTIATLTAFVSFQIGAGFPNRADAALARLGATVSVACGRLPIRRLATRPEIRLNDVLFRIGARTGERPVQVEDLSFETTLEFPLPAGGRATFGFRDLLLYRDFSQKGDSGGPVVTHSGALVGLHIARNNAGFGMAVPVWSLPAEWKVTI